MQEVTIIGKGTHSSGSFWLYVEAKLSGFLVRYYCYPESLDGLEEGATIKVPQDALKKA